jgi:hypothetical protein
MDNYGQLWGNSSTALVWEFGIELWLITKSASMFFHLCENYASFKVINSWDYRL